MCPSHNNHQPPTTTPQRGAGFMVELDQWTQKEKRVSLN